MDELAHSRAREYLQAAADGRLAADERAALDAHLAACAECRAYAEELGRLERDLTSTLRARWPAAQPPRDLVGRVQARVAAGRPRGRLVRGTGRALAGLAALVLIAVIAGLLALLFRGRPALPVVPAAVRTPLGGGARIASVVSLEGSNNDEIYVAGVDGAGAANLTHDPAQDYSPVWSRDGQRIAFISDRGGMPHLYVMQADGSNVTQLIPPRPDGQYDYWTLSWSPDGQHLATLAQSADDVYAGVQLVVCRADGTAGAQVLTEQVDQDLRQAAPKWSPDGTAIAFAGGQRKAEANAAGTPNDLFVISPDGGEPVNLTRSAGSITYAFTWFPGGGRLAYLTLVTQPDGSVRHVLSLINSDGSGRQELGEVPAQSSWSQTRLLWSPDGTRLLYAPLDEQGAGLLYLIDSQGGLTALPAITGSRLGAGDPSWSSDGRWLVLVADPDGLARPYLLDIDRALGLAALTPGEPPLVALPDLPGDAGDPSWQPETK